MDQQLRTTNSLAGTSTGGGRVRGNVPDSLANRLGPLPSSDVRERLGIAPPPRRQPFESRLRDQLIRVRLALRPYRGRVTRPPRQLLPV